MTITTPRSSHALLKLGLGFIKASKSDQGHGAISVGAGEVWRHAQACFRLLQGFLVTIIARKIMALNK